MDEKTEAAPRTGGWLKAFYGTLAGVLSGAVMMYLSPLLDKVIKPAKPLANFAVDLQGLSVQFHNRSSSKADGWWDFGDGAPLEPLSAGKETMSHTYAKAGTYTVKLTLRNILNEESERSVTINVENTLTEPPAILSLDAVPVSPGSYAPATFRLVSRTKNARLCVWDTDEDRPLEFVVDPPEDQDRVVTFAQPGGYIVKLAAVNGKQAQQKSVIVQVQEAPAGSLTAWLHVTEQMTQLDRCERLVTVTEAFGAQGCDSQPIERQIPARPGYEIAAVRIAEPIGPERARNLAVRVAPDKGSAILSGELFACAGTIVQRNQALPPLPIRLQLTEERRTLIAKPTMPVTTMVPMPGSTVVTLPSMPSCCANMQRQFHMELRDGDRVIWQDSRLPNNVTVTVGNHRYALTATPIGDQVRIDLK
jgi:PKD repeat protein